MFKDGGAAEYYAPNVMVSASKKKVLNTADEGLSQESSWRQEQTDVTDRDLT